MVEFFSADESGDSIDPASAPAAPRPPRWTRAVWFVVAVLVVAGFAAWALTRPASAPQHAAAAQPSHTLVVSPPLPHPPPIHPAPPPIHPAPPPTTVVCTMRAGLPHVIERAIRRYFPHARVSHDQRYSCTSGTRLVGESAVGRYHGLRIDVSLRSRNSTVVGVGFLAPAHSLKGTVVLGGVQTESAGVKVLVQARGKAGTHAPFDRLQRLADYLSLHIVL